MDLINRVLSGGLIGVLPLVAILLASAGGYFIVKQDRRDLIDSPWVWAFAFTTVGLLGVWAISGKYDDRQKRVEARYEARQRFAEQRAFGSDSSGSAQVSAPATGGRVNLDNTELQAGYTVERQVPLRFLAGGLLLVSVVSVVMLSRTGRITPSTARATTDEPQRR